MSAFDSLKEGDRHLICPQALFCLIMCVTKRSMPWVKKPSFVRKGFYHSCQDGRDNKLTEEVAMFRLRHVSFEVLLRRFSRAALRSHLSDTRYFLEGFLRLTFVIVSVESQRGKLQGTECQIRSFHVRIIACSNANSKGRCRKSIVKLRSV